MGRGRGGNNGIIAISVNIQEFRIPFMKKHPILSYLLLFFFFVLFIPFIDSAPFEIDFYMLRITFIPHVNLSFHSPVSIHLPLSPFPISPPPPPPPLYESLSLYGKNEIFVFV